MHFILSTIRGLLSLSFYVVNTIACCLPLFVVTLLKLAIPWSPWRKLCSRILIHIAGTWVMINNFNQKIFSGTRLKVNRTLDISMEGWYLVMANHQSWVDILVLQNIFHRRIPMLKFFLKQNLIWVPVLGLAWWALDFPFMKRYSKKFLEKNPQLRGKDIEITIFPGVDHAFMNDSRPDVHDATAAASAWARTPCAGRHAGGPDRSEAVELQRLVGRDLRVGEADGGDDRGDVDGETGFGHPKTAARGLVGVLGHQRHAPGAVARRRATRRRVGRRRRRCGPRNLAGRLFL